MTRICADCHSAMLTVPLWLRPLGDVRLQYFPEIQIQCLRCALRRPRWWQVTGCGVRGVYLRIAGRGEALGARDRLPELGSRGAVRSWPHAANNGTLLDWATDVLQAGGAVQLNNSPSKFFRVNFAIA